MRSCRFSIAAVVAVGLLAPASAGATALVPLAPGKAWTSTPIHAASPPGDPRLFVAERGGGVRLVEDGVLQPTPFFTVPNVSTAGERGLLSIAFAPDYAASGLFYVFTVAAGPDALDPAGLAGDVRIVEFRRSASNPDLADPASARLVFAHDHSGSSIHNAGQIAFGPEGLLYVTIGDAGDGANAQSLSNDLGKVLRIDPRDPPGAESFSIPPSNPFVGTGGRPEIYALGLRNPYRASFGPHGELIVADVGNGVWEEVDLGAPTDTPAATTLAGANLGWPNCEGACTPPNASFVDPVFQYGHGPEPAGTTGCAIIGGYVVRDPSLVDLGGRYLYGDLCRTDLRTLDLGVAGGDPRPASVSLPAESGSLLGFGEDGRGCLYAMTALTVYRVASSASAGAACPLPPVAETSGAATTAPDSAPPGLRLDGARSQRLRRFVTVLATCDEPCTLAASGTLRFAGARASSPPRLVAASRSGARGQRVHLRLKLPQAAFRRAIVARKRHRRVSAQVVVTATDDSGNAARGSQRIALR